MPLHFFLQKKTLLFLTVPADVRKPAEHLEGTRFHEALRPVLHKNKLWLFFPQAPILLHAATISISSNGTGQRGY